MAFELKLAPGYRTREEGALTSVYAVPLGDAYVRIMLNEHVGYADLVGSLEQAAKRGLEIALREGWVTYEPK